MGTKQQKDEIKLKNSLDEDSPKVESLSDNRKRFEERTDSLIQIIYSVLNYLMSYSQIFLKIRLYKTGLRFGHSD
jgi:uncharacterized membrane protein (DUF485 family)